MQHDLSYDAIKLRHQSPRENSTLNNPQALNLVIKTFTEILNAHDVRALEKVLTSDPMLNKWQMDRNKYPELQLQLTADDISTLVDDKLDKDLRLHADLSACLETPLEKLLYALAWKNGDLQKVVHIIKGAIEAGQSTSLTNGPGQVFKQFGRHLADRSESIVDQHVLRAFELYELYKQNESPSSDDVMAIRKKINWDKDVACITRYKTWLKTQFSKHQRSELGFVVNIDMVLFALGRAIKITRTRGNGEED